MSEQPAVYTDLRRDVASLLGEERDPIANAANCAALIYHLMPDVNWAGFYFLQGDTLVLGPFQGKPACVRIALGRGVCGTAAERRESIVVPDVHQFPGHIACDSLSRSEVVVPLVHDGQLLGVLDVDSPLPDRFSQEDRDTLVYVAQVWLASCHEPHKPT